MVATYYKITKNTLTQRKQYTQCVRCGKPVEQKPDTQMFIGLQTQNNYCKECLEREFYLLAKVKACIQLLGGEVSLHEVLSLYDDAGQYQNLKVDPFKEARTRYQGHEKLKLADIHKWVNEGIIHKH